MAAKSAQPKPVAPSFAAARERLDEILAELERDTTDVDQLTGRIKEASALIRFCRERLAATRQDVQTVVAELAAETAAVSQSSAVAPENDLGEDVGDDGSAPPLRDLTGDLPF